jgi:hypothetical protein
MSEVVLLHERFHAFVDTLTVSHVADGSPEQATDAAERVSAVEGALRSSESSTDTDEDADATICFKRLAGYGVAVAVAVAVPSVGCLPESLRVFAPGLVPCPPTWVVRLQGTIHVYVTVDVGFLKEARSGRCGSCGIADVDSFRIARIESSTKCLFVVGSVVVRGERMQFIVLFFPLLDGEDCSVKGDSDFAAGISSKVYSRSTCCFVRIILIHHVVSATGRTRICAVPHDDVFHRTF